MRKERTHYTAEEKVAILRRHLLDKVPVSDLCEELAGFICEQFTYIVLRIPVPFPSGNVARRNLHACQFLAKYRQFQ